MQTCLHSDRWSREYPPAPGQSIAVGLLLKVGTRDVVVLLFVFELDQGSLAFLECFLVEWGGGLALVKGDRC